MHNIIVKGMSVEDMQTIESILLVNDCEFVAREKNQNHESIKYMKSVKTDNLGEGVNILIGLLGDKSMVPEKYDNVEVGIFVLRYNQSDRIIKHMSVLNDLLLDEFARVLDKDNVICRTYKSHPLM